MTISPWKYLISRLALGALLCLFANTQAATLPEGLQWQTNDSDPVYASPNAKKGGTLNQALTSFPLTLRWVGPDANGGFRSMILGNQLNPVSAHPNTLNLIPVLATHWAYSDDNKTMYFRLNPKARWSDGERVKPEDFAFTIEFYRSREIVDPWYNNFYSNKIDRVDIYDDYTFSVSATEAKPRDELHEYVAFIPTPRHFFRDMENFVQRYNWSIVPNTGPYQISEIKKGKSITFKRKKDWWGKDLKYFKNRFNVDKVKYTVLRDPNVQWEYFKKGKLDMFGITLPLFWHEKATGPLFDKGYIKKLWLYQDSPEPTNGIWLNKDNPILKDKDVRLGIAYSFAIDKVNEQVLRGDYLRKNTISSGFADFANEDLRARQYDIDKANAHFDKAGWNERGPDGIRIRDGKRLSLSVTYGNDLHTPRLVVLREEFKKVGLDLQLRKLDSAASFKSVREKKHDIWWGALVGGRWPQYWGQFHSVNAHKPQTNNFTNTDDKDLDKLIDAYRAAVTHEARIALAHEIQAIIHEDAAWIPRLDTPFERFAYWRWVRFPDVPGTRIGGIGDFPFEYDGAFDSSDGGLFWIDKDMKKETLEAKKSGKSFPPETRVDKTFKPGS